MAARSPIRVQRDAHLFSSVLSSAVCEWLLMLLLFLDALFSYLVTKFARFCELQTPCLLCSRLDNILGSKNNWFYRDLICDAHKSEMCESCLLSFATEKQSKTETYRSLVGKLGMDLDNVQHVHLNFPTTIDGDGLQDNVYGEDVLKVPLLKNDLLLGSPIMRHCSCCTEPFRNKSHAHRLLQNRSTGADIAELDTSLLGSTGNSCLHDRDGLSKRIEKSSGSTTVYNSSNHGFNCLSHIGYSELKITSDSESEVPFSDDDDGNALVRGNEDLKEELVAQCMQPETVTAITDSLSKTLSDDMALEKLIHHSPIIMPESSLSVPERQLNLGECHDISSLASTVSVGHDLEELNRIQIEARANPRAPTEIISQQVATEVSNEKYVLEIGDVACFSTTSSWEGPKALSSTDTNMKSMRIQMDLNDTYKFATGIKGALPSPTFTEIVSGRDSSRVHDDLKLVLSRISTARGLECPWNDTSPSPRIHGQGDENFYLVSNSTGLQSTIKKHCYDRNKSGWESLEGSIVSEFEGQSAVDQLKRQVELDKKSMSVLYKDLEEERSASAIAANQAMAMITRLQEEKAAMQMEALQYQRMMEDQAEYDQEALQNSNDLLALKEKELQDLEAEVECYRKRFRDESLAGTILEPLGPLGYSEVRENNSTCTALIQRSAFVNKSDKTGMLSQDGRIESVLSMDPFWDFEDEKAYISECLKRLEKNLRVFSNNGVYVDAKDGLPDKIYQEAPEGNSLGHLQWNHVTQVNCQMREEGLSARKDSSLSKEDTHDKGSSSPSTQGAEVIIDESHKESLLCSNSDNDRNCSSMVSKESDLASLGNEVSHLSERLEALEADRNFLEYIVNSLRNGSDGVQFIKEIACHLQELRRIGITRSEHIVG